MDTLRQDLRFAVRMLAKNPGFTAVAVLCIAFGIGTNVVAFSIVSAVLLRPFPYAEPETIVHLIAVNPRKEVEDGSLSYLDWMDYREQVRSLSQAEAYGSRSLVVSGGDEPERISGVAMSAGLFRLIGETPALGRNIRDDEDRPGAPPVVLLGHDLWMRRFNGDPRIVGTTVMINATAHTVIGVMKPRFSFPEKQEAWIPLVPQAHRLPRHERRHAVMARLAPGVSRAKAAAEVSTVARRLEALHPDTNQGWGVRLRTLREVSVGGDETKLLLVTIQGAAIFILLIACANVANLFLARATTRLREVAVRLAFGAGRGRIVRQLLTESLLVALAGGILGIVFGHWGIRWMAASIPAEFAPPYWMRFTIDVPVVVYTFAVTVLTGILFGLAPALQAARQDLHGTLKEGGRGAGGSVRNRLRSGLVVAEISLALTLLVVTALFLRSFLKLQNIDVGFSTAHLLTMRVFLPGTGYEEEGPKVRRVEDLIRRLEALPDVESVAASSTIALSGGGSEGSLELQGRPFVRGEEPTLDWTGVSPGFFRVLGLPVVRGRALTEREGMERSAVALVNETFAKRFFPEAEVLGQRFRFQEETGMGWITIVGVVPDCRLFGASFRRMLPVAYLPYPYLATRAVGLTIRTRHDPALVTAQVRKEIRASDPELPVYRVSTMEQVRQQSFWQPRVLSGAFSVFGAVALFLAAIGVYGVLSYSVSQRVREIGVRMALGAKRSDVLRLVVGQGVSLALAGVAIGLVLAFGAGRVVASVLFDVSPSDPISFAAIAVLLTAVASFASFLPAHRAMEVDPLEALRNE